MVALITSTLIPFNSHSFFSKEERLKQTLITIEKLYDAGFKDIFLIDNSVEDISCYNVPQQFKSIHLHHCPQYTFGNKGLNEALLILNNIHLLPAEVPVFKISSRYYPTAEFKQESFENFQHAAFMGVGQFNNKTPWFSTRAYYVKNKMLLESTLILAIEEMISYSKSINGVRSFYESLKSYFYPYLGTKYQISLEQAFGRILQKNNNFSLLNKINIEGYIAGSDHLEYITE
jgi:hypothetical protein